MQRRREGSNDWVEAGATTANVTTFSSVGLLPATSYRFRVRAFNDGISSTFSNEVVAVTAAPGPTLTGIVPTRGPVGTRVTLTGTCFLGATAVRFNEIPAARFEVVSETSIEAVVHAGAPSGPISVVAPGGSAVSTETFTVIESGIRSRLFVPIVLRSHGGTAGSFFTSELTLTNRGTTTAAINYTYTAAFGGGSGTAVDSLEPGRQRIIPDAIAYLTALGVHIGSSSAGGTLVVDFSNLSSPRYRGGTAPAGGGRDRSGWPKLRRRPVRHGGQGGPERHCDWSPHGGSGQERRAVQPLLQRGALG